MHRLFWLAKTRSGSADIRFECKYLKKETGINSLIILDLFIITADQILSFSSLSVMFFAEYRKIVWKKLLCKYLTLSSLLFSFVVIVVVVANLIALRYFTTVTIILIISLSISPILLIRFFWPSSPYPCRVIPCLVRYLNEFIYTATQAGEQALSQTTCVISLFTAGLRTFALIVSAHPHCARNS